MNPQLNLIRVATSVVIAISFLSGCGSETSDGTATTLSTDILAEQLKIDVNSAYSKVREAQYKVSQPNDGVLDKEDVSAVLLNEGLYSKVVQGWDISGISQSRNLCTGVLYDDILAKLNPKEKVFNAAIGNWNGQKSRTFVGVDVQLTIFPDVRDSQLISLYQTFSDAVSVEGPTCDSVLRRGHLRGGQPANCELKTPRIPNWYHEADIKDVGCTLGATTTPVFSSVEPIEIDWFNSPFFVNQLSSESDGYRLARSVVILPQRTLKSVFVLEVNVFRMGETNSASDQPTQKEIGKMSARIAGALSSRWAKTINQDFDLVGLIAKDAAIFTQSQE
jgi:hypothetical protein